MNRQNLAIGIGLRDGATAADIVTLVRETVARHKIDLNGIALFTLDRKINSICLRDAARELGVGVNYLPLAQLAAHKEQTITRSATVESRFGVGSICETAALAGAGPGARLIAPRSTNAHVACALAIAADNIGGSGE
jgi:cobalt-precorrin 5A hydrolase